MVSDLDSFIAELEAANPHHLEWVADQLASCRPLRQIQREIIARGYASDAPRAKKLIEQGYVALRELAGAAPSRRDQYRDALQQVFEKAMELDDPRAAVAALDRLIKLDGDDAPVKATGPVGGAPGDASAIRTRLDRALGDPDAIRAVLARFNGQAVSPPRDAPEAFPGDGDTPKRS